MAEETLDEKVDETTDQSAADETKTLDYDQEFNESVEKFERSEKAREGYAKRKGITEEQIEKTQAQLDDIEAKVAEAIKKQLPKLQSTLAEDTVEAVLKDISSNDAEAKLIRFHFENSVSPNGTIRERLENAKLIANKKTILKTQKEMAVAINNRAGLSPTGLGASTEGQPVKDQFFSQEQLNALKARGWDEKKIERLKANLRKLK